MAITSIDQLDDLSDDELWEVAANTRIESEIRFEAIQRWLYPEETNPDADPDEFDGGRLRELKARATKLPKDEVNEFDSEDQASNAPYFDSEDRLIVEYNGVQYLIDTVDEEELDDDDSEE